MKSQLNADGNIIGRLGAVALLAAAGFGLHRLNCSTGEMCPVMQTQSCCTGGENQVKAETPKAKDTAKAVPSAAR